MAAPDWLHAVCHPDWGGRDSRRVEDTQLPKAQAAREALAVAIGTDGHALLGAVYTPAAPA